MRRLLLLVVLLVLGLALPAGAGVPAAGSVRTACPVQEACPPVVVVGVGGLQWTDVGAATPALQRLAATGAVGALSVKALPPLTCRADGWLTLGAGARAEAYPDAPLSCGSDLPTDLREVTRRNAASRDAAQVGALHAVLARTGGLEPAAVGDGARVALGWPPGPAAGDADEAFGAPRVLLVDEGVLPARGRADALRRLDARVGERVRRLPPDAHVLVVGLSERDGARRPHLHVAIGSGPLLPRGALVSASTRRAPYVQLVDVAPTVLDLLGQPVPARMDGEPWRVRGPAPTVGELRDVALLAEQHRRVTVPFFVVLLGSVLLLVGLLWRRRPRMAEHVALGGVAALGASYVANLVPWWRSPVPLLALLAVVAVLSAVLVTVASRARGVLEPAGVVCAVTAAVLLLDLLTGGRLQMSSVPGYSPLVAGRFAGLGNVAFGVLAAAVLLALAATTRRPLALAVLGAGAVAVVGAPPWGSDVGGVLALVPALVLLALLLAGRRASVLRLALAGTAGAAVVAAFALADWSRPAQDRTHLGRFVQDVLDGTAGTLLRRKAEAVLDLLFANPVTALLPLLVAAAGYLLVRPPAPLQHAFQVAPAWRIGLLATALASGIGFAVNDSGAAVPATALAVAVPATLAVVLRARRATQDGPALLA